MLTGVETAGVVLAVVPLLVLALEKWHGGFVKTRAIAGITKSDKERLTAKIKRLVTELKWHDAQLSINLKSLLLTADEELDIESLPQDYKNEIWKGPLGDKLEKYLKRIGGKQAVDAFNGFLKNSERFLEEIAQSFEHPGRNLKGNRRDLKALCDFFNQAAAKPSLRLRSGFTLHEKDIDRLAKELRNTTRSISSFVVDASNLDTLMTRSTSEKGSRQLKRTTNTLYNTRKNAVALFQILQKSWLWNCQHIGHTALLHLNEDCQRNNKSLSHGQNFHVLFQWLGQIRPEPCWKETAVFMNTDSVQLPTAAVGPSRAPLVQLSIPSLPCHEVIDLCQQVEQTHTDNQHISFHVSDEQRLYCVASAAPQNTSQRRDYICILPRTPCLTGLDVYLSSANRKLLDRKRIELAIKLACAILQYNETPWFRSGWRKENIFFFENPLSGAAIDVDHPLISQPFSKDENISISPMVLEPQDTLLEFAVLLMELYHRIPFEKWVTQRHPKVDLKDLDDMDWKRTYAMKWYNGDMPRDADFRGVISVCLWPHPLQQYESSWEDEQFRCAFYENVIAPLLEL